MSDEFAIGRVIAALDASCHDLDLLPAAVELAARLEAEVAGLFIEDQNLLRLWSLPAARHVTIGSPAREVPSTEQMQAELRALASQAAAALSVAATRQGVPWSFRVVRGRPEEELDEGTMAKDLVVVGPTRSLAGALPMRLTSPLDDAARQLGRSTVLVPGPTTLTHPMVVIRAGSPLMVRTLAAAIRLARPKRREMHIVLVGNPADTAQTETDIVKRLAPLGATARVVATAEPTVEQLARAVAGTDSDIFVAASDVPLFHDRDAVSKLLERTGLPVMIVRG